MTPFAGREVIGKLKWSQSFSRQVEVQVVHGAHRDELKDLLKAPELIPGSAWDWETPSKEPRTETGRWFTLSSYPRNGFGPLEVRLPQDVLEGRLFLVLHRLTTQGDPLFILLEVVEGQPLGAALGWDQARQLDPRDLFEGNSIPLNRRPKTAYQAILTRPVALDHGVVHAVAHEICALGKCNGRISYDDANDFLRALREGLLARGPHGRAVFDAVRHRVHAWQEPASSEIDIHKPVAELVGSPESAPGDGA